MRETPIVDGRTLTAAGAQFEQFAAGLPAIQAEALRALVARAATVPTGLGDLPAEAVLSQRELAVYRELAASPLPPVEPRRPVLTAIMKATRLCNLRCTYCHSWRDGPNQRMTFPVLARAIRSALQPGMRHVDFVWHGGEPTTLPLEFFRKALWLQERFRSPGQAIENSIQTNGTRLTPEWLDFLREHRFSVGVSLDGPPEVHDLRRLDAAGRPTAARVRDGLDQLRAARIRSLGVLMVVDEDVVALGARRVLDYLLDLGVPGVAVLNVLPDNVPPGQPFSGSYLPLPRYIEFLRDLFRLWWPDHVERLRIRELSTLVAQLRGGRPEICIFAGDCFGLYLTIEPTGEIAACDKYIGDPRYRFGSILHTEFSTLQQAPRLTRVQRDNTAETERMLSACRWSGICHGACPHDRYTGSRHLPGYDSTCCGYAPLLEEMAATIGIPAPAERGDPGDLQSLVPLGGGSRPMQTATKGVSA